MTEKKRVYCLYRVSTLKQLEEDDIPMQRKACEKFVEEKGWDIICEKVEKGVSGFKVSASDRDDILEIQKDAIEEKFDILLVFMLDRLGRRDDETPFLVEWFVHNGIEVWSTKEGQQTFDNHTDKLTNYIHFWQASGESIKTSMRTKTALGQMVLEGKYRGGTPPFGYRLEHQGRYNKKGNPVNEIVIDEVEEEIVRLIFDKYAGEGYGAQRIKTYLTKRGIFNRKGNNFVNSTIQNMLKNIKYTGRLRSGETVSEPFPHLRIIKENQFDRVQEMLKQRSNKYKERNIPYHTKGQGLLSGNLFCGHCGARMVQTSNIKRYTKQDGTETETVRIRYVCYNKREHRHECDGQYTYAVNKVDEYIRKILNDLFSKAQNSPQTELIQSQYKKIRTEVKVNLKRSKELTKKLTKDYDSYKNEMLAVIRGESFLDRETLNQLLEECKGKLDSAENFVRQYEVSLENSQEQYEEISKNHDQFLSWAELFDNSSKEAQKMIVSEIISKVQLKRGYDMEIDFTMSYEEYCRGL